MWHDMKTMSLPLFTLLSVSFYGVLGQTALYSTACPGGYVQYGTNCYKAFRTRANWIDSKSYCQAFGATLLIVDDQGEEDFIWHYINSTKADYPTTDFWVDGSDLIFENDWMWVRTDSLFKYTDWDVANNNPSNNNGYENCMEISLRVNATWNDDNCEKMQSFICEREGE